MGNRLLRSLFLLLPALCTTAQQPPAAPRVVTAQEWNRVHKHPKTVEDFRLCAQWCRQEAEKNHQKEAVFEEELKALHARPANHEGPRYPPTQDELREEIAYYQGQSRHWTELAEDYEHKAAAR
jgi:membrane-bound lytic murein transglycosylase B